MLERTPYPSQQIPILPDTGRKDPELSTAKDRATIPPTHPFPPGRFELPRTLSWSSAVPRSLPLPFFLNGGRWWQQEIISGVQHVSLLE